MSENRTISSQMLAPLVLVKQCEKKKTLGAIVGMFADEQLTPGAAPVYVKFSLNQNRFWLCESQASILWTDYTILYTDTFWDEILLV